MSLHGSQAVQVEHPLCARRREHISLMLALGTQAEWRLRSPSGWRPGNGGSVLGCDHVTGVATVPKGFLPGLARSPGPFCDPVACV